MISVLFLLGMVALSGAELAYEGPPRVVRLPQHDSAIIQSHRLGGNFAYSTHEAHAYGVTRDIIKERVVPKGVTYHHGPPVVKTETSVLKVKEPQFAVVNTEHTIPVQAVQYSAPVQYTAPVQYSAPVHVVPHAAPAQAVQYSVSVPATAAVHHSPVPANIVQYSAIPVHTYVTSY